MEPSHKRLFFWAAATLIGGPLHFLYDRFPGPVTALFAPDNESLCEHGKLLFWPILGAALLCHRRRPSYVKPWLVPLPLLLGLMLGAGYLYHVRLGGSALWVDLLLYTLLMALGFWLPTRFSPPYEGPLWTLPVLRTLLLGAAFARFTFHPPGNILFQVLD